MGALLGWRTADGGRRTSGSRLAGRAILRARSRRRPPRAGRNDQDEDESRPPLRPCVPAPARRANLIYDSRPGAPARLTRPGPDERAG